MEPICYLASPYSHPDPSVRAVRFNSACRVAAEMIASGMVVFSPIAHSHPIATCKNDLALDWKTWEKIDLAILDSCSSLLVLRIEGWEKSLGVQSEVIYARSMRKRIGYIELDQFPVWEARAVNVRHHKCDVYVGRANSRAGYKGHPLANPFKSPRDGTPAECVAKYEAHIRSRPDLMHMARGMKGLDLGCWCVEAGKDVPCHANIVAAIANEE